MTCDVLAEVVAEQARVARAEAALEAARRRLSEAQARLGLAPPLEALEAGISPGPRGPALGRREGASMRARILAEMGARPEEVWTPARLSPLVGARSRDSVRNTLLVLAAQGRIEKVGLGQYRAAVRHGEATQQP
jgi:hypothetical protein